jgi:hypothetical protein
MKATFKSSVLLLIASVILWSSCKKDEFREIYAGGTPPTLTSTAATLDLRSSDSSTTVIKFNWTDPDYKFSSSSSLAVTYILQIDSSGKNFTNPQAVTSVNIRERSYTGKSFNTLLFALGFTDSLQNYGLDVRVRTSLYLSSTSLTSNTIKIVASPYPIEPPTLYPVPANLFIVGDATAGGWGNPVPVPSQQFTKINNYTFGIITQLNSAGKYLFLPVNGDWAHKYAAASGTASAEGTFNVDAGSDIPTPAVTGLYKIIVNFVTGKYTVTAATAADVAPAGLFIVGDATLGGWNNPVPVPSQQFTKTSNSGFEITVNLTSGRHYLFLPVNGDWAHKYAVADNTISAIKLGGTFIVDSGQDFPSPDVTSNYKIQVEFITKTYKLTKL